MWLLFTLRLHLRPLPLRLHDLRLHLRPLPLRLYDLRLLGLGLHDLRLLPLGLYDLRPLPLRGLLHGLSLLRPYLAGLLLEDRSLLALGLHDLRLLGLGLHGLPGCCPAGPRNCGLIRIGVCCRWGATTAGACCWGGCW